MPIQNSDGSWISPCYEKLKHGEPYFVLRAQDKIAPLVVAIWCLFAKFMGVNQAKIDEALECADQMEKWEFTKIPD